MAFLFHHSSFFTIDSSFFILKELLLGLLIAVVLWVVFWIGEKLSQLMFAFARPQVDIIYSMKDGHSPILISLLLLFIIGPAEELFWRGFIQRSLADRHIIWGLKDSRLSAFIITTSVYTLVHLPSFNPMLILSALTCGIIWGGLYYLIPRHFLAILISHAVWDAAAFVWFPL